MERDIPCIIFSFSTRQSQRVKEIRHEKVSSDIDDFMARLLANEEEGGESESSSSNSNSNNNNSTQEEKEKTEMGEKADMLSLPVPTKEEEVKNVSSTVYAIRTRPSPPRGIVDWIVSVLEEICAQANYYWGPLFSSKVLGLQAIVNRHSPWFKKVCSLTRFMAMT